MGEQQILPKLSTVVDPENVFTHTCGSSAFFAWGIKIMVRESIGKHPRLQNMANYDEVIVCAKCLGPVVILGSVMYDASEYVSKEQVNDILMYGQAREHKTPLKVMDV